MIKWERELQVKVRKIKPLVIKHVEDAGSIVIIEEKDSVHLADLVELQN